MIDFSSWLDLPLVWALLIATAVILYALLDGFDLGVGILFPFAPSTKCRSSMMNSIAPFWDGNETWLVLGGGGLFATFPVAYAIIMPAVYLPIIFMLLGLVFRGVAFEFRFKSSRRTRRLWDSVFHFGSLTAAFMQGMILGNFVQGFEVLERSFAGAQLDWVNGFSLLTGLAVVFGYALLGSTWLVLKTTGITQKWARRAARYVLLYVALFMVLVSLAVPFVEVNVFNRWFSYPNFFYMLPLPLLTFGVFIKLTLDLRRGCEVSPFLLSICLFLLAYIGFGISMYPWIVPFELTIWDASAASTSLSIILIGTVIFLPIILVYTALSYYTFRGKSSHEVMY